MQEPKRACPFWCSQSAVRCSLIADRCYQSIFQLYSLFAILSIFIHNSPTSKGLLRTVFCIAARDCKPAADSLPAKARPPPPTVPAGRLEAPRKGIGRARCRTPQSAGADITGLRSPHHAAHAEACLHSATAAPAPSRCIRRRRRSTPQPLTGEPFKRQSPQSLPCKGRWMRRKAQTEGCIAGLRQRYPAKTAPLPCLRRGRCWHRPLGLALPQDPAAGVNARPAIHGKREVEPGTAGPPAPGQRGDPCVGPPSGLTCGC